MFERAMIEANLLTQLSLIRSAIGVERWMLWCGGQMRGTNLWVIVGNLIQNKIPGAFFEFSPSDMDAFKLFQVPDRV